MKYSAGNRRFHAFKRPKYMRKTRARRFTRAKNSRSMVRAGAKPFGGDGVQVQGKNWIRGGIFPRQLWCDFRYSTTVNLTTALVTGLIGAPHLFRLNSLFDPDETGIGHQPYRFDQVTPMYGKYTVEYVTVRLEIVRASGLGLALAIYTRTNVGAGYSPQNAELDYVREKNQGEVMSAQNVNGNGNPTWTNTFRVKDIWGVDRSKILSEDGFSADTTLNPQNVAYLGLACGAWNLNPGQDMQVSVSIVQHARMFAPLESAFS